MHFPQSGRISGGGSLQVVNEYRPSGHIGGDFYCLLPLSESNVGIFLADVMGHGVGAALRNVSAQCDGPNRAGEIRRSGRVVPAIEPPAPRVISR